MAKIWPDQMSVAANNVGDGSDLFMRLRRMWSSRPIRLLLALAAVAIVGIIAVTAVVVFELRAKEIGNAKHELTRLNVSLTEQSARSFQSIDLILNSVVQQLQSQGIDSAAQFSEKMAGRDTYEMLRTKTIGIPQLDAITLIGADGHLVNFSRSYPIPQVNVADRDYFRVLSHNQALKSFLSMPVKNRGNGAWTIYLARRIDAPNGRFIGLVLGGINLDYFQDFYKTLAIEGSGSIAMWRGDGTLLARSPKAAEIGHTYSDLPFQTLLAHNTAAAVEVASAIDGRQRIIAIAPVRGYPIFVSISRTMRSVLADWRHEAAVIIAAGFICAVAVALVFFMLLRLFRTYERLSRAVAQREEAIRARERAEAQVQHLMKLDALGQLTGGIAHDFNNLLTVIIGSLDLLQNRLPPGSEALGRLVETAMRGAERGATMTHRLLAFSRRQPLAPEPVDANRMIVGMSDLFQRTLGESVIVSTDLTAGLWRVFVDSSQLESALLNLAVNARDAMPEGGRLIIRTANVALHAASPLPGEVAAGEQVLITVSDSGIGMPPELVERACEPFFTTKEPGRGTGLGLSQVYGFIRQSGGHLEIASRPGAGTTIKLYLPRHLGEEGQPPRADETRAVPAAARQDAVLVVEDEEDVRSYSAEVLRELGYQVVAVADGAAALEALEAEPAIRLLLTDVGLPGGLNGRQLADEARRRRPSLAVLFTTGYDRGALGGSVLAGGMALITKPFAATTLATKVRQILESGRKAAG